LSNRYAIEKYDGSIDMTLWEIDDKEYYDFNEYKYSNPEAFFYWVKTLDKVWM